jgi:hypothetical protein
LFCNDLVIFVALPSFELKRCQRIDDKERYIFSQHFSLPTFSHVKTRKPP